MGEALWMPEHEASQGPPRPGHAYCPAEFHDDHQESVCLSCGCCWGCEPECCSEKFCPNKDCGCSAEIRGTTPSLEHIGSLHDPALTQPSKGDDRG